MEIPIYYDPMIAKLVTFGKDRKEAIEKMLRAIEEYQITGIATTLPFGTFVLNHPAFISGDFDTKFIQRYFNEDSLRQQPDADSEMVAAVLGAYLQQQPPKTAGNPTNTQTSAAGSAWKRNRTA